jgi:hypothetical protein
MDGVITNYFKFEVCAMVRFLKADEERQSEIHHRQIFETKTFSAEGKCLCFNKVKKGRSTLNDDPEKHKVKLRTSHTDENCVIV